MYRYLAISTFGLLLLAGSLQGQSFTQVTNNVAPVEEYCVQMSADGNTLVWFRYDKSTSSTQEIWTWDATTRKERRLVSGLPWVVPCELAISGDGSTVVYPNQKQLWKISTSGGTPTAVTTLASRIVIDPYGISLSDDGRLVCCSTQPAPYGICDVEVIDTVTLKRTNITNLPIWDGCRGCISGDGKKVAFSTRRTSLTAPGQIWLANADGSGIQQLTSFTSGWTGSVRLDRRSTICAFEHYWGNSTITGNVYTVSIPAKVVTDLSRNPRAPELRPAVSADGERVTWRTHRAYNQVVMNEIHMDYPEGSTARRITTFGDQDPSQQGYYQHGVNHDGSVIAFTSKRDPVGNPQPDHEVWIFEDGLRQTGRPVTGSVVTFLLNDPAAAGDGYLVRSAFARSPGFKLPGGATVPLAMDPLFGLSGQMPWIFRNYSGVLDGKGGASASVAIPRVSALVGLSFYTSFVSYRNSIKAHNVVRTEIQAGS